MVHLNLSIVAHVHKICPSRCYSDPSNASAAYQETFQILLRFHGFVDSLWSYNPPLQFLREANLGGEIQFPRGTSLLSVRQSHEFLYIWP